MRFGPSFFLKPILGLALISINGWAFEPLPEKLLKVAQFVELGPVELHPALVSDEQRYQRLPMAYEMGKLLLPVFRIESFENTELQFYALAPHRGATERVVIAIEGPFSSAEKLDATPIGSREILFAKECSRSKSQCRVNLAQKGMYRVYAIPQSVWDADQINNAREEGLSLFGRLLTVCTSKCGRDTMNWKQLADYLKSRGALDVLAKIPVDVAAKLELSTEEKASIVQKFSEYVAALKEAATSQRFPVLGPSTKLKKLQAVLKEAETHPKPKDAPLKGDLFDLLAAETADRERSPKGLTPELKEVSYGHYIDNNLSDTEIKQSKALAHILTALSELRSETEITVKNSRGDIRELHRAEDVMSYLIDTGHYVETRDERTYANFLALRVGPERDGIFPPWLRTGLKLGSEDFQVPMGHSQHAWRIWGPKVRAKVAFYLGIAGTGFFPVIDSRPIWTGNQAHVVHTSLDKSGREFTLRSIQAGTIYYKRNRKERAKLPEDGYGLLGVCNDASAFVSYVASHGALPVSAYPLLRASESDIPVDIDDRLKPILAGLPKDVEIDLSGGVESEEGMGVLRRIVAMDPHDADSPWYPDLLLKAQMKQAQALVIQKQNPRKN